MEEVKEELPCCRPSLAKASLTLAHSDTPMAPLASQVEEPGQLETL